MTPVVLSRSITGVGLCLVLTCSIIPAEEADAQPLQIRILKDGGCLVLSRGNSALAAVRVRTVVEKDAAPVLLDGAWREVEPLAEDAEVLRSASFRTTSGSVVSVLLRAQRTRSGVRLLLSPAGEGATVSGLELVVQVLSDEEGKEPALMAVDAARPGIPTPELPAADGTPFRATRLTFQGRQDTRIELARSAPVEWRLEKVKGGLFLRQGLLPDPRRRDQLGSFMLYLGNEWDGGAADISPLRLSKRQTPVDDLIEGSARIYANGADPYAFDELSVMWEVAWPDGHRTLHPCFFWEGPSHAPAEGEFRLRFAPTVPGVHGLRLRVILGGRETFTEAVAVEVGPRASRGFAQTRTGERQFRFTDGTVFLPVGLNVAWPPHKDDAAWYRETFRTFARNGINTARVWLCSWGLPLEGPIAGRYDPTTAEALDEILLAAQAREIYVLLVAENAHDLAARFEQHPYSRSMRGPLPAAVEFFKDQGAEKYFKRRLTYLAARYGAYRSLLGWELFNELDEAWPQLKVDPDDPRQIPVEADRARAARRDVAKWVARMAQHLKSMDGGRHPITVSTSLSPDHLWSELDDLAEVDWLSPHGYVPEGAEARQDRDLDETALLSAWSDASRGVGRPHKPYWLGEFGYRAMDDGALKEMGPGAEAVERNARDASGLLLHNSLMAGLASGQAGTPLHWWWDRHIALNSLWIRFRGPATFAAALERITTHDGPDLMRTLTNASEREAAVRVLGRVGRTGMGLWLQDKRSNWAARLEREEGPPPEVSGLALRAPALAPGDYTIVWLDVWKGEEIRRETVKVREPEKGQSARPIELKAPSFQRDVAVLIESK